MERSGKSHNIYISAFVGGNGVHFRCTCSDAFLTLQ